MKLSFPSPQLQMPDIDFFFSLLLHLEQLSSKGTKSPFLTNYQLSQKSTHQSILNIIKTQKRKQYTVHALI